MYLCFINFLLLFLLKRFSGSCLTQRGKFVSYIMTVSNIIIISLRLDFRRLFLLCVSSIGSLISTRLILLLPDHDENKWLILLGWWYSRVPDTVCFVTDQPICRLDFNSVNCNLLEQQSIAIDTSNQSGILTRFHHTLTCRSIRVY